MYKAFWGIMGALTILFLGLLGTYLYKSGAFENEEVIEEAVSEISEDLETEDTSLEAFLQPSEDKYGDAMKAMDERETIRTENTDDHQTKEADTTVIYEEPSSEVDKIISLCK